jgi:hypothetical protein
LGYLRSFVSFGLPTDSRSRLWPAMHPVRQGLLATWSGNRGLINMARLRMPPGFAIKGSAAPQYVAKSIQVQDCVI